LLSKNKLTVLRKSSKQRAVEIVETAQLATANPKSGCAEEGQHAKRGCGHSLVLILMLFKRVTELLGRWPKPHINRISSNAKKKAPKKNCVKKR
jgi:hypothetical protein